MVWHLGDFCFGKRNLEIAAQLNGNKKLVMGNHDMYATEDYLQYFTRLSGAVEYKGLVLTHVPVHECQLARWYMNVHGHLHTKRVMKPPQLQFNGSIVEGTQIPATSAYPPSRSSLTPVPFDWILNKWAEAN